MPGVEARRWAMPDMSLCGLIRMLSVVGTAHRQAVFCSLLTTLRTWVRSREEL